MKKFKTTLLFLLLATTLSLAGCSASNLSASSGNGGTSNATQTSDISASTSSDDEELEEETSSYNVVFNLNYDGAERGTLKKVEKGAAVGENNVPTEPQRAGDYNFTGWYTDRACTQEYNFTTPVTDNIVLYAGWKSGKLNVYFNYNYIGGPNMEKNSVAAGGTIEEPATPERENYKFLGWYEKADGSGEAYDFTTKVQDNKTLYAKWALTTAVVTFDLAADGQTMENEKVNVGEKLTEPQTPTREAYDFDGWVTADGEKYDFDKTVSEDMTESGTIALTATWKKKTFTVTLDWGDYVGGATSATVEYGETLEEPTAEREGYVLVWQLNGEEYLFSTPVTQAITLEASWTKENSDTHTVKFMYNYTDSPSKGVYDSQEVADKRKVTMPDDPEREGYYFDGWFTDAACTTSFNSGSKIKSDTTIYASWLKVNTFEAEYVDLDGVKGAGYSNEASGLQLIKKDTTKTAEASNGYYISSMFQKDSSISFVINAAEATDNAVLILRVQAEFVSIEIDPESYIVAVNGTPVKYSTLKIEADTNDISTDVRRAFFDFVIDEKISLKKGENIITLTVNNTQDFDAMGMHFGTLSSYAPMIDCIRICTNVELTWKPKESNITEWEAMQN